MQNRGRQSLFLLNYLSESILELGFFWREGTVKRHTTASAGSKQAEALLAAERGWVPAGFHPAWAKAVWSAPQETPRIKNYIPSLAFLPSQSGLSEGFNQKAYTGGRAGGLSGFFNYGHYVIG